MDIPRIAGLALIATIAANGHVSATTYAEPPVLGDSDHPNTRGGYEQSYVTSNVNVRRDPSSRARVINRLRRGDYVNVGECRGAWCYVDVHGGNGWVLGRLIGRGDNPYSSLGPADADILRQEPSTSRRVPIERY